MPTPNQRTIRIPNRIIKNQMNFDRLAFEYAIQTLSGNAFKLWCYFHSQSENQDFVLSSNDFCHWANCSLKAYNNNFKKLVEYKFLQPTTRKTYFIFVEYPKIYKEVSEILEEEKNKKISLGEKRILELLTNNDIKFAREVSFGTCLFPDTHYPAKFDFLINNSFLLEYDGQQHYEANGRGWNTQEQLIKTQEHDIYKNQWCKENSIPLIRIPYTKLDTLTLEDLMLETTQFRVV